MFTFLDFEILKVLSFILKRQLTHVTHHHIIHYRKTKIRQASNNMGPNMIVIITQPDYHQNNYGIKSLWAGFPYIVIRKV